MILASNIIAQINSKIDSEGSERYLFDEDIKPSINYAIEYALSVFNSIFSKNKLSEEILKELVRVRCWIANQYSRVSIDDSVTGDTLWSVLSVMPLPTYAGVNIAINIDYPESHYVPSALFISSKNYAKRLTREQWGDKETNRFMAGSSLETCLKLKKYAWVSFADYKGNTSFPYIHSKYEIEISPSVANQVVAISYLRRPTVITTTSSIIELPEIMTNFIVSKALEFLSAKQNDQTTLYGIQDRDTKVLISLFS